MSRRGRRLGLTTGYLLGIVGALIATAAVIIRSFPLLLIGTFVVGFGNASNNLSRYAAADLVAPKGRAVAIGLVVWGSTVGGIVGPWLAPDRERDGAERRACRSTPGRSSSPCCSSGPRRRSSFLFLRPDPFALAHTDNIRRDDRRARRCRFARSSPVPRCSPRSWP